MFTQGSREFGTQATGFYSFYSFPKWLHFSAKRYQWYQWVNVLRCFDISCVPGFVPTSNRVFWQDHFSMADIFISFIHEEEQVATAVQRFIQAHLDDRRDVFLSSDQWAIYAGERWLEKIITELREAKVVVSLLSPASVQRPWVNFEAGAAWIKKEETALIPACFGGMKKGEMPKPYFSLQAVQLEEYFDQHYLLRSVFHYLKRPGIRSLMPPPPFFDDDDEIVDENSLIEKARKPYRELREALNRYKPAH